MAGSRTRVDSPESVVVIFSLESSMKMRSFLSQWMEALGSAATRQRRVSGSPSHRATSWAFSLF